MKKSRSNHMAVGFTSVLVACSAGSQQPAANESALTRGMYVEPAPMTLSSTPYIKGSRDGVLRDKDTLRYRDRIQLSVRASDDAHLYLAYCSSHGELTLFPKLGSIEMKANQATFAPSGAAALVVDAHPGAEVLYVIASRARLSSSDPQLAAALAAAKPDGTPTDCGPTLQTALAKSAATKPAPVPAPSPRKAKKASRVPPPVTIERGMEVEWTDDGEATATSGSDGIVVLRYEFNHVELK